MKLSAYTIGINAVVLIIISVGALSLIKSAFTEEVHSPCGLRYATLVRFPDSNNLGQRLRDEDLSIYLDGDVQGLSKFTRVIHPQGGNPAVALEVRMPKGSLNPRLGLSGNDGVMGGMGFKWRPVIPQTAQSACLTYKVWLPKGFNFASGGILPGLFGGAAPQHDGYQEPGTGFSTHLLWEPKGRANVRAFTADMARKSGARIDLGSRTLPTGRWVELAQEVKLNTPGQKNGELRVWIDGELAANAKDLVFRDTSDMVVGGVLGDVFYRGDKLRMAAPNDTYLRITPFELNWN